MWQSLFGTLNAHDAEVVMLMLSMMMVAAIAFPVAALLEQLYLRSEKKQMSMTRMLLSSLTTSLTTFLKKLWIGLPRLD